MKDDVERPMPAVFDAPVGAVGVGKKLRIKAQGATESTAVPWWFFRRVRQLLRPWGRPEHGDAFRPGKRGSPGPPVQHPARVAQRMRSRSSGKG